MYRIDYAHLYVEKYANGELLLDFTSEKEFLYFVSNGDFVATMKLEAYTPSILLFRGVKTLKLREGDIVSVKIDALIEHKREEDHFQYKNDPDQPVCVFAKFADSTWFEELFYRGEAFINNRLRSNLLKTIEETWPSGTPCSLGKLTKEFYVEVVDVGQGSTNLIYDDHSLTLFDFGASIYSSKKDLYSILDSIIGKFNNFRCRPSLIISHWDVDHYNLLTAIEDKYLNCFCCVFAPAQIISLTAQQVARRLSENCLPIRTFCFEVSNKNMAGMHPVMICENFELYLGNKSKNINKSGISLVVKSNANITIFGADHSNKQIWQGIYPNIFRDEKHMNLNVIAPHHGGNCGKHFAKKLYENPGVVAISVGKNAYKHPHQTTIDKYNCLGFEVKRTDWEKTNIVIEMK